MSTKPEALSVGLDALVGQLCAMHNAGTKIGWVEQTMALYEKCQYCGQEFMTPHYSNHSECKQHRWNDVLTFEDAQKNCSRLRAEAR